MCSDVKPTVMSAPRLAGEISSPLSCVVSLQSSMWPLFQSISISFVQGRGTGSCQDKVEPLSFYWVSLEQRSH